MSLHGPLPEAVATPEELAATLGSDEIACYAAACRPVYEDLRRIIGQISGLLILAQLTQRSEQCDLPEYRACVARASQARERLAQLVAPAGAAAHKTQIDAALAFSCAALGTVSEARDPAALEQALDRAGLQIKRAYAHLRAASASKAGLEMVDLSHACCGCGRSHGA